MPITHRYDPETHVVTSVASGDITPEEGLESHRRIAEFRDRHPGLGLIADMRDATVAATPAGVLDIMEAFYRIVGPTVPVAFILREDADDPNPMLAKTRGFLDGGQMESFPDEKGAHAWLASRVRRLDPN